MFALILAGGQGTRLGKLTKTSRNLRFNLVGAIGLSILLSQTVPTQGIHNVGVITQYQPLALNSHIGNGSSWGLDGINTGVSILNLIQLVKGNRWFEGTSHAILQNIDYIDSINPGICLDSIWGSYLQDGLR